MSEALHINEKTYVPVSVAAREVSYSRDHITRLARDKKIRSVLLGRQWYVDPASLAAYIESAEIELTIRKRLLSVVRKDERVKHARLIGLAEQLAVEEYQFTHSRAATWWSGVVVMCGVGVGALMVGYGLVPTYLVPLQQPVEVQSQLATVITSESKVSTSFSGESSNQVLPVLFTATAAQYELPTNGVGVLLLPGVAPTAGDLVAITEMFSDPVVVTRDQSGTRVVTPVHETGALAGVGVPFITVPITHVRE